MNMLACVYEDRVKQLPGVMLLVHTLARYCPDMPIRLRIPDAPLETRNWLRRYPLVTLLDTPLEGRGSYNVKASVLLDGLASGASCCLWLDTDVLINGSLAFIQLVPDDVFVATADPWIYSLGASYRAEMFGLESGRELDGPLNSAVVRVTRQHEPLLRAWAAILKSPDYLAEQSKPVAVRNPLMLGDQDALSALLASKPFALVPVRVLEHPSEILQHHGPGAFGPKARVRLWKNGLPPLLHAMGAVKPWNMSDRPSPRRDFKNYYERLYLESSPYVTVARRYRRLFGADAHWLELQSLISKYSLTLTKNNPVISGTLQATLHQARRALAIAFARVSL